MAKHSNKGPQEPVQAAAQAHHRGSAPIHSASGAPEMIVRNPAPDAAAAGVQPGRYQEFCVLS